MSGLKTMHLFAGAGGGLLADLILGHEPVIAVEWEPYACQILRERAEDGWFPSLSVYEGDVRLFDPSEYAGRVDCIHAGFPCQDISLAGKQAGVGPETRSGLYREVLRIAGVVRPRYLFLENVSAIVTNGLDTVLADLIALGYDSEWLCLRASDCGAAHHRDRWWLLADNQKHRCNESGLPERTPKESAEFGKCRTHVAHAMRLGREGQGKPIEPVSQAKAGDRQASDALDERVGDFWQAEPGVGILVDGLASALDRDKGLSDAEKKRDRKILRTLREADDTKAIWRPLRRHECISQEEALQQGMRKQQEGYKAGDLVVESEKTEEAIMRSVWFDNKTSCSSCRSGYNELYSGQHSNAMRSLSQLLACTCGATRLVSSRENAKPEWWEVEPEIGRVTNKAKNRVDRIKALGNGQVPIQAAAAWRLLVGE